MKKIIRIIAALLIIIALGSFIAWKALMNAPKASAAEKPIDISIAAQALYQEYSADEVAGDKKYISQVIQVKGKITDLYEDEQGAPVALLGLDNEDFGGILCTFEVNQKEKLSHKTIGDSIIVKGICSGLLMEVVLNRCNLIQ